MTRLTLLLTLLLVQTAVADPDAEKGAGDAFLQHYDRDGDGKVSLAEYQAPAAKQFLLMDLDADGSINAEEASAFVEKLRNDMLKSQSK
jgi:hypothetical protein